MWFKGKELERTGDCRVVAAASRMTRKRRRFKLSGFRSCALMCRFNICDRRAGCECAWATVLVAVIVILQSISLPQSMQSPGSAQVHGSITDSENHPLGGVMVQLRSESNSTVLSTITGPEGVYVFSALQPGKYRVEAEKSGYRNSVANNLTLKQGEERQIDLRLSSDVPIRSANSTHRQTPQPQFFDEPTFTVAGVTDVSPYGGHGSDRVLRSSESLAKAAAALDAEPAGSSESVSGCGHRIPPSPADSATEASLRRDVLRLRSYDANFKLGKLLVAEAKYGEALPYLERASRLGAADKSARQEADLHELLGTAYEQVENPLQAVREFERAAELDPTEGNIFDWGAELLLHRAFDPAIEVFNKGRERFPQSMRMRLGLGATWYARGSYDQAARTVCETSDLNPEDPNPYLFMGRIQSMPGVPSDCFAERLARFAQLYPDNALANYYLAVSLWRSRKSTDDAATFAKVEALLQKSLQLDPQLAAAYLELGIMKAERKDLPEAISDYQRSIALDPENEETHYRLSQAYGQMEERSKSHEEFEIYEKIKNEQEEKSKRERHDMRQFVYTLKRPTAQVSP